MPADRRPLPLVTADGPVCNHKCELSSWREVFDGACLRMMRFCGRMPMHDIGACLPALREAWLRERDRVKRTCGRCVRGVGCPDADGVMDHDESCSRFEERKDG